MSSRARYKGKGKKNILIISGVHGDEKTPVAITQKIIEIHDSFNDNYRNLVILHAINKPALEVNSRYDNDFDLNRAFDGNHDNHVLVNKIKKEIEDSDIIIDIHSSKSCMELLAIDNTEYGKCFCDFADQLCIPYVIHKGNDATIKRYCLSIGKPCFTVEVNKLNEVDHESASKGYDMVSNIVENINQLNFQSSDEIPTLTKSLLTKEDCVILPLVNVGDLIQPNQKVAIKINRNGDAKYILSKEKSPCKVLTTNYIDYQNDDNILKCNTRKNITLFSISG